MLLLRAVAAFLALPAAVAFALPVWIATSAHRPWRFVALGVLLVGLGTLLLLWCVREFYVVGRGTLAPWDPPQHLVTTGPYRFSRNPDYGAQALLYLALTLALGRWWSTLTLIPAMLAIRHGVISREERYLERRFGDQYRAYKRRVRRWI